MTSTIHSNDIISFKTGDKVTPILYGTVTGMTEDKDLLVELDQFAMCTVPLLAVVNVINMASVVNSSIGVAL
jgi:hypothetical protein